MMLWIGHVRYINILAWLRGLRVKIAKFANFFCLSIPKRDLDTKKTTPNIEVRPESLGAMLLLIYRTWPILHEDFPSFYIMWVLVERKERSVFFFFFNFIVTYWFFIFSVLANRWMSSEVEVDLNICLDSGAPAARKSPILIWERKENPWMNFLMVIMATGIARGRVRTTTTTESHNMAAILQVIGWQRHAALVYR